MYLDEAIQLYNQLDLARVTPCAEVGVQKLEQRMAVVFPAAYREFLLWAGEHSGDLFPDNLPYDHHLPVRIFGYADFGMVPSVYDSLPRLNPKVMIARISSQIPEKWRNRLNKQRITELLAESQSSTLMEIMPVSIPDDSLIFLAFYEQDVVANGYFLRLTEGANPPVYRFQINPFESVQTHDRFSDFVLAEVIRYQQRRDYLSAKYGLDKPLRQTHYLDSVKQRYAELGFPTPKPCTLEEMLHLERRHCFAFPDAFREFLLWAGHWASVGLLGSEFFYEHIYELKPMAADLLRDLKFPGELPEDAVVFFMHQGYQFAFTRPSTGEEARVFYFQEGETTFTDTGTLANFLLAQIEWMHQLNQTS